MRGRREPQAMMLAFVDLEERVPRNHRVIKQFADRALADRAQHNPDPRRSIPSDGTGE